MKRSKTIRLVLIGGLSAGALTSCGPTGQHAPITPDNVYTNNQYVPGAGYYHAPFRAWYSYPYNHYDAQNKRYYHGGEWTPSPHQSITNISSPTPQAAQFAQAHRTDISRGGFGSTSRSHHTWS